jgi:hypothetical protein
MYECGQLPLHVGRQRPPALRIGGAASESIPGNGASKTTAGSTPAPSPRAIARMSGPPRRVCAVVSFGADAKLVGDVYVALRVGHSRGVDLFDHVVVALPNGSTVWARDLGRAPTRFLRSRPHLEAFTVLRVELSANTQSLDGGGARAGIHRQCFAHKQPCTRPGAHRHLRLASPRSRSGSRPRLLCGSYPCLGWCRTRRRVQAHWRRCRGVRCRAGPAGRQGLRERGG